MIEVTFNDSLGGMLKIFFGFKKDHSIVVLPVFADLGDLSKGLFSAKRFRQVNAMLSAALEPKTNWFSQYRWRILKNTMRDVIDACKQGEPLRIWYSNSPEEFCAAMAIISQLSEAPGSISVIHLQGSTAYAQNSVSTWDALSPSELSAFLAAEHFPDHAERRHITEQYTQLCANNSTLRVCVDGRLLPVAEDYYDDLIRKHIPETDTRPTSVLWAILKNTDEPLPLSYLKSRCAMLLSSADSEQTALISPPNI